MYRLAAVRGFSGHAGSPSLRSFFLKVFTTQQSSNKSYQIRAVAMDLAAASFDLALKIVLMNALCPDLGICGYSAFSRCLLLRTYWVHNRHHAQAAEAVLDEAD